MSKDFDVAIVGGGMCGLACAIGLAKSGIKVAVFEAAAAFEQVGAGVGLGPNSLRALKGLDIFDAVLTKSDQPKPTTRLFVFVEGTGSHKQIFDYAESSGVKNCEGLGIYRPAFLDALMPLLDPACISFNKHCTAVEELPSGRQLVHFSDGTTHETDLVIGADGIKSVTRKKVVGDGNDCLGFSGTYAYRGLIPMDQLKAAGVQTPVETRPYCYVGLGKHIITFPIKGGTVLNVVAFDSSAHPGHLLPERPHPWVEIVSTKEIVGGWESWGDEVQAIVSHLRNPSRWSIHTLHPPLKTYVSKRVVLVGDSAHAMLPHLGAGVGQGFEDVYVLCRVLSHKKTTKANLEAALAIYDELRVPRANMVLEQSIKTGKIYENYGPGHYDVEDMRRQMKGMWEPVWHHDLEAEVDEAIRRFEMEKL
ncbi:salicylate hydroxylase [Agrocybe pediades]|nr:salicylate hydroxylase [Agrocybe pediades]